MAYLWFKAFHIVFVIAWMAGLFYLPRLFVYHAAVDPASESSAVFKVMEHKLYSVIMVPAMVLSWVFAIAILNEAPELLQEGWFHTKLLLVVLLTAYHFVLNVYRRRFAEDRNRNSHRFFRYLNEVPTLLMIGIVILVIVRPF